MKVLSKTSLLIGLLLILSACQTTNLKDTTTPIGQEPLRTIPVDVQSNYINVQALEPQDHEMTSGNLFANGGFESGLDGWTACSPGAIKTSSDAYEGSGALEVIPSNCFYKSAEVTAGDDLILSCYAKITEGTGWTGMGLGFADSNWTTIDVEVPATVITGSDYARYDVAFTAPANSKYASMWFYSDNPVVVDNCSLMLEATPPPPPPPSGDNLLQNGEFETLANGLPTDWAVGCGGSATSVTGRSGKGLSLTGGVCVDQGLSASDISALSGNEYTYSCYVKNTGGYASISIFLDDQPTFKPIPVSSSYALVEIKGTAAQVSSGFVSIYSEGGLTIDQCSLTTGDVAPPPPPPPPNGDNLLENGGFETLNANSKPVNWSKGCGGSYDRVVGRSGNGLSLTGGACVDQPLSSSDLTTLANKQYTYSCYAKNTGGYASMSIFFDDVPTATVIPQSNDFQLVEVTGTAPSAGSGFVSIYSEAGLIVDDCSLTVEDAQPVCVDPVNIPDPVLKTLILNSFNNPSPQFNTQPNPNPSITTITCANLQSLTFVNTRYNIQGAVVTNLEGLQYATNLGSLSLGISPLDLPTETITDLTPLKNLTKLGSLILSNHTGIQDLSPIENLTNLQVLTLDRIKPLNFDFLTRLDKLISFSVSRAELETIPQQIENLRELRNLALIENQLSNISFLVNNPQIFTDGVFSTGGALSRRLNLFGNCLDISVGSQTLADIQILEDRGIEVTFSNQGGANCN